jgi:hypothetical protein
MQNPINQRPIAVSPSQERFFARLALSPDHKIPKNVILRRIGIDRPTASHRAEISRSLSRLWDCDLIKKWHPYPCRQGKGPLWSLGHP